MDTKTAPSTGLSRVSCCKGEILRGATAQVGSFAGCGYAAQSVKGSFLGPPPPTPPLLAQQDLSAVKTIRAAANGERLLDVIVSLEEIPTIQRRCVCSQ